MGFCFNEKQGDVRASGTPDGADKASVRLSACAHSPFWYSLTASSSRAWHATGVGTEEGLDTGTEACPKSLVSMPEGLAGRPLADCFFMEAKATCAAMVFLKGRF